MKILYKEYSSVNYTSYQFPYCIYAIREPGDDYTSIYSQGFLPYSNDLERREEIFYLARSIRIDLKLHKNNYKQNNIHNKLNGIYNPAGLAIKLVPKLALEKDPEFFGWCLKHAKNGFLQPDRLKYILDRPYLKDVLEISYEGKMLARVLIISENKDFIHVWFSFYDTQVDVSDFGKWIILKVIDWSKNQGYRHFYIGTCYPPTGFYKLTLSSSTEYFDGEQWDADVSKLKKGLAPKP